MLQSTRESASAGRAPLRLGIVVAIRNEARWIDNLLESIRDQQGLENVSCIAAVDGRSQDESRSILETWKGRLPSLRLLDNEEKIAPVGFNIGIRACLATGADVVLLVSGHSRLHPCFLAELQHVLTEESAAIVGCVLDYPEPKTSFERAAQAFVESRLGRRMGSYSRLTRIEETEIATFPAIRREVFERVGFFDETMVRNQDIEFTARARTTGFRILTSPKLKCRYSPPATLGHLVRQMYGNGFWVGRRLKAHGARHVAPAAFFSALLVTSGLAIIGGWPWTLASGALAGIYLLIVTAASLAWSGKTRLGTPWLLLSFLGAHCAYAIGTFRGLLSRGESRAVISDLNQGQPGKPAGPANGPGGG